MNYGEYLQRLRKHHGDKLRLPPTGNDFAPWWGKRIEVRCRNGELMRGWVAGTAGWMPSLMLLKRRDSTGSHQLLENADKIVRVLDDKSIFAR